MSLKYNMFLIKMSAKDLKNALLMSGNFEDITKVMKAYFKWDKQKWKEFHALPIPDSHKTQKERNDVFERSVEILESKPEDPVVRAYHKDTVSEGIRHLDFWFMDCPFAKGWSMGCHSGYRGLALLVSKDAQALEVLAEYSLAKIGGFYTVSFHGGCDDGDISLIPPAPWTDYDNIVNFKHHKNEESMFDRYTKRISKKTGAPLDKFHSYMDGFLGVLPWQYELRMLKNKVPVLLQELS